MEFKIKRRTVGVREESIKKEEFDLAYKFAKALFDEFGDFLKAVVLFGSSARKARKAKDIDILVVVDDVTVDMSPEVVETYRIIMEKTVVKVSSRLHITSIKFASFWEYARAGDPVAVNILRDGIPLIDSGFFKPLQALLADGRIRPSPESVWTYFGRAPRTMGRARGHITQAALDLYWAVVDAAHAALMMLNVTPPSPDHVGDLLDRMLVSRGLLHKKHVATMRKFYKLQKQITHREIQGVSGKEFDKLAAEAQGFVDTMKAFIESREFASPLYASAKKGGKKRKKSAAKASKKKPAKK